MRSSTDGSDLHDLGHEKMPVDKNFTPIKTGQLRTPRSQRPTVERYSHTMTIIVRLLSDSLPKHKNDTAGRCMMISPR
ncbi:hypothetical protein RRG08_064020 [Elysia crispata]|uniref:Uncharacterized protein n=1 Tax=Elysia crispata TaxID=231223 RepID=A0AAE0YEJ3_9GAST|nr:hypothetical protein RRG08_064020 [Elysia crispata]